MEKLIGKKIQIEYGDQNINFEKIFPKTGEIISRHITDNVDDWFLVKLDEPFEYNGRNNDKILIRSRWEEATIKDSDVSVFVLLIPHAELIKYEKIDVEEFEHVTWGKTNLC